MKNHEAQLKCTWTNGIIWAVIATALGLVCRYLLIYFCLPTEITLTIRGVEMVVMYTTDFYNACMVLLMSCIAIPVFAYLFMYYRYMKIAGAHPADLHAVATGRYGRPWIPALIIQLVLTVLWTAVGVFSIAGFLEMYNGMSVNDRISIEVFLVMMLMVMVFDLLLFFIGKILFKPDLVQKN